MTTNITLSQHTAGHERAAAVTRSTTPAASRALAAVAALGLGLAALTGCSAQPGATSSSGGGEASASATTNAGPLTLRDGWAKAADSGMTAAFGTLTNSSDRDVTLTGARADGTAGSVQLHETVTDKGSGSTTMQEKSGGFTIPAGGSITLEPGGNHIMLMDLTCSLKAGGDLTLQLDSDAGTQEITVPVRDFSGAKEEYAPGSGASGSAASTDSHEGMDMSSHGSGSAAPEDHSAHGHGTGEHTGAGHDTASASSTALPECHAG